jgi:O-antigen ligase
MPNKNKRTFKQPKKPIAPKLKGSRSLLTYPPRLIQPLLNLYTSYLKEPARGKLLTFLFLILPWNLGKHLELEGSYFGNTLIPYLVPVLFLQDLLVSAIVGFYLFEKIHEQFVKKLGDRLDPDPAHPSWGVSSRLFFLFVLSCLLSLFFSSRFLPSFYYFSHLALYFLFFVTSWHLFGRKFIRQIFCISIIVNLILLSLLGFAQFQKQASFFNNYRFFGEQPYTIYTPSVAKESYAGVTRVPPYGTFEHPNIFAGYLAISLTFLVGYFVRQGRRSAPTIVGGSMVLFAGFYVLALTKSTTARAASVFSVSFLIGYNLISWLRSRIRLGTCRPNVLGVRYWIYARLYRVAIILIGAGIIAAGLMFPILKNFALGVLPTDSTLSALSVERRAGLLTASYQMFLQEPYFGWGLNSFTYSLQPFYRDPVLSKFYQPVHNVFVLILVETGIFGLVFFSALTFYTLYRAACRQNPLYSVVLLQIIFLASFDHYFFTIHQTLLLFILTLLLSLTYTKDIDCL